MKIDDKVYDLIYNTIKLEGVKINKRDLNNILNRIDNFDRSDSDIEICNNFINAVYYIENFNTSSFDIFKILDYCKTLNYIVIYRLHSNYGELRNTNVTIGGSSFIPPIKSEFEITNEIADRREVFIDNPLEIFCYVTKNQIFNDGNKRTAILMTNLLLKLRSNKRFIIDYSNKNEYLKLLIDYYKDNSNKDKLIKFLDTKCIY